MWLKMAVGLPHTCTPHSNWYRSKKSSCHRKAARRSVSLNILPSHSMSLKVISKLHRWIGRKFLLVSHCNYVSISCTVSEIFNVEKWRALENWVSGHSRSLKIASSDRSPTSSYWHSRVNMALSFSVTEIKGDIDRKSRFLYPTCIRRPC